MVSCYLKGTLDIIRSLEISFTQRSIYLQMDIKQALLNLLGDSHSIKPFGQNHRKNIIRSRNSHKAPVIQQADPSHKHYYLFKPINHKANAMAMKYVESHHPSIKGRVAKILSQHRNISPKANNETIVLDIPNDDNFMYKIASRKHSSSTITYQEQYQRQDKSNHSSLLQILKPCKISSVTLFQRAQSQYKKSKTISSNARTLSSRQFNPKASISKKRHYHSTYKENGFFTGWEPIETENQPLFS